MSLRERLLETLAADNEDLIDRISKQEDAGCVFVSAYHAFQYFSGQGLSEAEQLRYWEDLRTKYLNLGYDLGIKNSDILKILPDVLKDFGLFISKIYTGRDNYSVLTEELTNPNFETHLLDSEDTITFQGAGILLTAPSYYWDLRDEDKEKTGMHAIFFNYNSRKSLREKIYLEEVLDYDVWALLEVSQAFI